MVDISLIFDEATNYTLKYGKHSNQEPLKIRSELTGSDAFSTNTNSNLSYLRFGHLEILLTDYHVSQSSGTYSVDWSETYYRRIEIYFKKDLVVKARKCLGGKEGWSGMFSSSKKEIKPTNWQVEKAESIERVIKSIERLRKKI